MSDALDQLDRDAALLMYLAGELPEEQRVQMQRRLETEAALRAELALLQEAQVGAWSALQALDQADGEIPAELARRTAREVRRQQTLRLAQPKPEPQKARRNWWLAFPAAAAAAVVLALLTLLIKPPSSLPSANLHGGDSAVELVMSQEAAAEAVGSLARDSDADEPLAIAERHLDELASDNGDDWGL